MLGACERAEPCSAACGPALCRLASRERRRDRGSRTRLFPLSCFFREGFAADGTRIAPAVGRPAPMIFSANGTNTTVVYRLQIDTEGTCRFLSRGNHSTRCLCMALIAAGSSPIRRVRKRARSARTRSNRTNATSTGTVGLATAAVPRVPVCDGSLGGAHRIDKSLRSLKIRYRRLINNGAHSDASLASANFIIRRSHCCNQWITPQQGDIRHERGESPEIWKSPTTM
jgi:hypothetical protein